MQPIPAALQAALAALVLAAAVYDVRYRRIPNWLIATGFVTGLALNAAFFSLAGLKSACLGAALALAVNFPLFALRATGAGDVKLFVAVGAFTGPFNWILLFVLTALLGGAFALILVLYKRQFASTASNVLIVLGELAHFRPPFRNHPALNVSYPAALRLPYAVPIAGGTLLFLALERLRP